MLAKQAASFFRWLYPEAARARLLGLTLALVANFAVLLTEYELVPKPLRTLYLVGKGALVALLLPPSYLIRKYPGRSYPNYLVAFLFLALPLFSSFFRPLYVVALFEHLAVFSFAFPVAEWFFIPFALAAFGALSLAQWWQWDYLPDAKESISFADFQHLNVQFAIILILFYFFFVRARRYREETERKLYLVGKNASNIAHDLKGMIMGPSLYLNRLMELTGRDQRVSGEITELLDLLDRQFGELGQMMSAFNQLCLVEESVVSTFSAAEAVGSARQLLWKNVHGSAIQVEGDFTVVNERAAFLSFCFNVMTNSLQAVHATGKPGFIRWRLCPEKREVSCWDNGGGFSPEALAAIAAATPYSSREQGTGLGVPVIRQAAKQLGGRVSFENHDGGALVRLSLP